MRYLILIKCTQIYANTSCLFRLFHTWMARSGSDGTGHVVDVVIALDALDMRSVLCVLYVAVEI